MPKRCRSRRSETGLPRLTPTGPTSRPSTSRPQTASAMPAVVRGHSEHLRLRKESPSRIAASMAMRTARPRASRPHRECRRCHQQRRRRGSAPSGLRSREAREGHHRQGRCRDYRARQVVRLFEHEQAGPERQGLQPRLRHLLCLDHRASGSPFTAAMQTPRTPTARYSASLARAMQRPFPTARLTRSQLPAVTESPQWPLLRAAPSRPPARRPRPEPTVASRAAAARPRASLMDQRLCQRLCHGQRRGQGHRQGLRPGPRRNQGCDCPSGQLPCASVPGLPPPPRRHGTRR